MVADKYKNFMQLSAHETLDKDYRIKVNDLGTQISVVAIHGGRIEPRTSEIAQLIAKDRFNLYCFEGIKDKKNQDLHITSHFFDEPRALKLISKSMTVAAIHAFKNRKEVIQLVFKPHK